MVLGEQNLISLVIPAYNESDRLSKSLEAIADYVESSQRTFEIILVVEKSPDETLILSQSWAQNRSYAKVIGNSVKKGKGYAVKTGMLEAKGEWVFFTDADLATPLSEIDFFLDEIEKRIKDPTYKVPQVLCGSRLIEYERVEKEQGVLRRFVGKCFRGLVYLLGFSHIRDTQCGFKLFHQETIKPLFENLKTDGFAFDVEVLTRASRLGYRIDQKQVSWHDVEGSKLRPLVDGPKAVFDLFYIALLNRFFLKETKNLQKSDERSFERTA